MLRSTSDWILNRWPHHSLACPFEHNEVCLLSSYLLVVFLLSQDFDFVELFKLLTDDWPALSACYLLWALWYDLTCSSHFPISRALRNSGGFESDFHRFTVNSNLVAEHFDFHKMACSQLV